jgi:hypothetical protein
MINLHEAAVKAFGTTMDKASDMIRPCCSKCGSQPRLITSMLEPKSGKTFHMLLCECGEKSWTADNKVTVGISDAPQ